MSILFSLNEYNKVVDLSHEKNKLMLQLQRVQEKVQFPHNQHRSRCFRSRTTSHAVGLNYPKFEEQVPTS